MASKSTGVKPERKTSQGVRNSNNGKNMENKCAKMWTAWTGVNFRRRKIEGHDTNTVSVDGTGDVICADSSKSCKFTIESKNRKDFSFTTTPFSIKSPFWSWFAQSACDARIKQYYTKLEYFPFLHFKPGSIGNFIALYKRDFESLNPQKGLVGYEIHCDFADDIIRTAKLSDGPVDFKIQTCGILISTWDNFIDVVDPLSVFH
jgi:hypothetical protein